MIAQLDALGAVAREDGVARAQPRVPGKNGKVWAGKAKHRAAMIGV